MTEIQTEQTKNYQGGSKQKDQAYSDVRMYENSTPLDPVGSFEFYLNRLYPSCQALFQTPNHHFKRAESRWFRNEPLGKNTIAKLMENVSSKAELSERYTNHCIWASTITALYQRGVDAKQICAITKHKDERSLSHYISQTTSEQKRQCSRILQEAFYGHPPKTKLLRLTFVNTFRRRKYRQDWRSHFSFANTAESFSLFSPAISKLHSAHSDRNYERLSWGSPFSTN